MAGRGASAAALAQIAASSNQPVHLVELYLDDETVLATDFYRSITWNANEYLALASYLSFDQIEETGDLSGNQTTVRLSGVDQMWIAGVLQYEFTDRRLMIRKAFIDAVGGVVIDPLPIFDGRCDQPTIEESPESGDCSVSITAGSHWVDFERRPGRHTNLSEQQIYAPGDNGFGFSTSIGKEILWGQKA